MFQSRVALHFEKIIKKKTLTTPSPTITQMYFPENRVKRKIFELRSLYQSWVCFLVFREKSYFPIALTAGMNTNILPDSDTFRVVYQSKLLQNLNGKDTEKSVFPLASVQFFDSLLQVYIYMIISDLGELSLLLSDNLVGRSAIVPVSWASR